MAAKILIVDDDEAVTEVLTLFLEKWGYEVSSALDGWDGIRQCMTSHPDLILMDLNMPKMDGIQTMDLMRSGHLRDNTPIIVTSSEGTPDTILRTKELGADDFLVKPFSFDELGKRIEKLLKQAGKAT